MLTLLEAGLLVSLAYHTLVTFAVLPETVNKPDALSTALFIGLWAVYLAATLAAPGTAWFAARGAERKAAAR